MPNANGASERVLPHLMGPLRPLMFRFLAKNLQGKGKCTTFVTNKTTIQT